MDKDTQAGWDDAGKLLLFYSVFFVRRVQRKMKLQPEDAKAGKFLRYCKGFEKRIRQAEKDGILKG